MRRARVEPIFLLLAGRSSSMMNPLSYIAVPRRSQCHRLLFLCPKILPTLVRDSIPRDLHIIYGFSHCVNARTPALCLLEKPHSLDTSRRYCQSSATRLSAGRPGQSNGIEPGSKRSDDRRKRGIGQQDEHGHPSTLAPGESHKSSTQTTRKLGGNGRYVSYESGQKRGLGTSSSAVIPWLQPVTNSTAASVSRGEDAWCERWSKMFKGTPTCRRAFRLIYSSIVNGSTHGPASTLRVRLSNSSPWSIISKPLTLLTWCESQALNDFFRI